MPRIDFLILANHAEVRDGLLGMLGGGWNHHTRRVNPDGTSVPSHFAIAVGVAFDLNDDATRTDLWIRIKADGDAKELLHAQAHIELTPREDDSTITKLAISSLSSNLQWPQAGIYHLEAGLDSSQTPERRFTFRVTDQPR